MNEETRAVFLTWRDEIEAEIVTAEKNLETSRAAVQVAMDAIKTESARIGALTASLSRLRPKQDVANALRIRLAKAAQPSPATATRGHDERVRELEFAIADMRQALAQIDIILRDPEPSSAPLDTRPPVPPLPAHDPIVLPPAMVAA